MPTCLVIQHLEVESGFAIETALHEAGVDLDIRCVFDGDPVPGKASGFAGVVVMGGSMSAIKDDDFPSRQAELALLASAVQAGVPTLGVCLGAQLLAASCGAEVYVGEVGPEIGWSPIELIGASDTDPLFFGIDRSLTVLHWHGETFALPDGATHLAQNAVYANQAFRVGKAAWGLQFHLEVTEEAVFGFAAAFAEDANTSPGGVVALLAATSASLRGLQVPRDLVLARFAALVSEVRAY